jgi:hypothetical protein
MKKVIAVSIVVLMISSIASAQFVGSIANRNDWLLGLTGEMHLNSGGQLEGRVESDLDLFAKQCAESDPRGTFAHQLADIGLDQKAGGGGDNAAINVNDNHIGTAGLNARAWFGLTAGLLDTGQLQTVGGGSGSIGQAQGQETKGTQDLSRDVAGGGLGGSTEIDMVLRQHAGNNFGEGRQQVELYGDQSAQVKGDGDLGVVKNTMTATTAQVQDIN